MDLREFFWEKHGQSQGYKSISRDRNVPVSTVRNIIKRFTALDVDGRAKLMKNYNEGLFEWWIKNPD